MVRPVDTDAYQLRIICPDHLLPEREKIPGLVKKLIPGLRTCIVEPVEQLPGDTESRTEIRMLVPNTWKYTNYVETLQEGLLRGQVERRFFTPFYLGQSNEVVPIPEGKWDDEIVSAMH